MFSTGFGIEIPALLRSYTGALSKSTEVEYTEARRSNDTQNISKPLSLMCSTSTVYACFVPANRKKRLQGVKKSHGNKNNWKNNPRRVEKPSEYVLYGEHSCTGER